MNNKNKKTILVTGSTGFIGKNLINHLKIKNYNIIASYRNNKPIDNNDNVTYYEFMQNDIYYDIEFIKNNNIEGCIHLATYFVSEHNSDNIITLINSNILFGTYILECVTKAKVNWFINTGTFWQNFNDDFYCPVNLYAATKQAFESIAKYYIDTDKIFFTNLKINDTYGINDTRNKIFNIWKKASNNNTTLDMTNGDQIIDICYIDDIIDAYLILIEYSSNKIKNITNGKTFVVKSKYRYTLKQVYNIFENITKLKVNINWGKREYRENEVFIPWENGELVPGWQQKISLENGLKLLFQNEK
jgi:CDP-paratose synthetase